MTYYLRYFAVSPPDSFTLATIREQLREADPLFDIVGNELVHDGQVYGELDIGWASEARWLKDCLEPFARARPANDPGVWLVRKSLDAATVQLTLRVLWQGRTTDDTFEVLQGVWPVLFSHYGGILHAEAEGYYDETGLVLSTDPRGRGDEPDADESADYQIRG